jgi:acyl-CoA hydrolase
MTQTISADGLDLTAYLEPGDNIVFGQACGEPGSLVEALIGQGRGIAGLSAFIGSSFSGLFTPETGQCFELRSMGALGSLRLMAKAGQLKVIPFHMSQIGPALEAGSLRCDVAMVQLSHSGRDGYHSCGLVSDHVRSAIRAARVVLAEINHSVPFTHGETVHASEIDVAIEVDRPLIEMKPAGNDRLSQTISRFCADFVGDGCVIQTGVGALPDAILRQLGNRRDLGVHSGMLGEGFVDLVEAGVITNARKEIDTGISTAGALVGTSRLYRFADRNPAIRMAPATYTHNAAVIAQLAHFIAINSAVEVDLTGKVNAEAIGEAYVGATGGLVDFARAAAKSPGGRSIIALPATAQGGAASRIVARLSGPVTLPRSDADLIVTEFGVAELKGCSLAARARRMVRIAHPDFQKELDEAAHTIARQGM